MLDQPLFFIPAGHPAAESSPENDASVQPGQTGWFLSLAKVLPPFCAASFPALLSSRWLILPFHQVSRCVTGPLELEWPVADNREEHVRSLQEVQQQHRRRDHPLLYAGGNAAGILSLDLRVLRQRAAGAWHARYFFHCKHTTGSCHLKWLLSDISINC